MPFSTKLCLLLFLFFQMWHLAFRGQNNNRLLSVISEIESVLQLKHTNWPAVHDIPEYHNTLLSLCVKVCLCLVTQCMCPYVKWIKTIILKNEQMYYLIHHTVSCHTDSSLYHDSTDILAFHCTENCSYVLIQAGWAFWMVAFYNRVAEIPPFNHFSKFYNHNIVKNEMCLVLNLWITVRICHFQW